MRGWLSFATEQSPEAICACVECPRVHMPSDVLLIVLQAEQPAKALVESQDASYEAGESTTAGSNQMVGAMHAQAMLYCHINVWLAAISHSCQPKPPRVCRMLQPKARIRGCHTREALINSAS